MVVTLTRDGYVKRTPLDDLPGAASRRPGPQRRPPRGEDDVVMRSFIAHTHQWVLFFTSRGMAFREKVWQLPEGGAQARGRRCARCCRCRKASRSPPCCRCRRTRACGRALHLVFATGAGDVRRNKLSDFKNVRRTG